MAEQNTTSKHADKRRLVFNSDAWNRAGGDVGDNSQFWQVATILRTYFAKSGEIVADVKWPDGTETRGHFVDCMRDVASV